MKWQELNPDSLPTSKQAEQPGDLLPGKRPDVVETYYDEGGYLARYSENGREYSRWENPDGGVIINVGGGGQVWMRVADPGVYYNAAGQEVPEREAARAGFNVSYWRHKKRALEIQQSAAARADQILNTDAAEALKSPEQKRQERTDALRAQAAKIIRERQRQTQAAADKMITRDLDAEIPTKA